MAIPLEINEATISNLIITKIATPVAEDTSSDRKIKLNLMV